MVRPLANDQRVSRNFSYITIFELASNLLNGYTRRGDVLNSTRYATCTTVQIASTKIVLYVILLLFNVSVTNLVFILIIFVF